MTPKKSKTDGKIELAKKPMNRAMAIIETPKSAKKAEAVANEERSQFCINQDMKKSIPPAPVQWHMQMVSVLRFNRYP